MLKKIPFFKDQVLTCLMPIVFSFIIIVLTLNGLDQGFILSDDGWYATLLRDIPQQSLATQFFVLYDKAFLNDILSYRVANYTISLLSYFYLAFGFYKILSHFGYANSIKSVGIIFVWLISFSFIHEPINTPNYINMNEICVNLALASLLIALSGVHTRFLFVLSGFCFTPLLFVIPTNVSLVALTCILVSIWTRRVSSLFWLSVGAIIFLIVYFSYYVNFWTYTEQIKEVYITSKNAGSAGYGLIFLVTWILKSLIVILASFFAGGLVWCTGYQMYIKSTSNALRSIIILIPIGISIIILMLVCDVFTLPFKSSSYLINDMHYFSTSSFIFFCSLVGFAYIIKLSDKSVSWREKLLWIFILCLPLFLSFGSIRPFHVRAWEYTCYYAPLLYVFSLPRESKSKRTLSVACLFFAFANFICTSYMPNWFKQRHSDQIYPMPGQRIFTDKNSAEMLSVIKEILRPQENVFVHINWGAYFVSSSVALDYNFRLNPQYASTLLETKYKDLKECTIISFVEDTDYIKKVIYEISKIKTVHYEVQTIGRTNLHRLRLSKK